MPGQKGEGELFMKMIQTTEAVKLTYRGREYELPIIEGSQGERAIDITALRRDTGLITLDPGYANTGSCTSAITFLDGEKGILRYRGIPVEQLAEHATFKETAYLLINGHLPNRKQLTRFSVLRWRSASNRRPMCSSVYWTARS